MRKLSEADRGDRAADGRSARDVEALSPAELKAEVRRLRAQAATGTHASYRHAVFESVLDYAIVVTDRTGRIIDWNPGAERILGWSAAQMIGQPTDRFFTPEDRASGHIAREMGTALRDGRAADERWHLRKGDVRFWSSGEMMPLRAADGTHQGYVKILRDRTEQHEAGRRVAASEAHYRTLFDTIDEGFCIIRFIDGPHGPESNYVHVEANPAFERHLGLPHVAGQTLRDIAPDEETDGWLELYAGVLHTGEPIRFEREFVPTGRYLEVAAHRVEPASRREVAVLFSDVTARVRAEHALAQSSARKAALLELGDRLRETDDADRMAYAAAAIMGRVLGATRAGYGTVDAQAETVVVETDWNTGGQGSIAGLHRFRDYGSYIEDLRRDEIVTVTDVTADPRTRASAAALMAIGVRTFVNVPLIEHGVLVAVLFVHHDQPHVWTPEEFTFVRNVADRTRAGIARVRAEEQQRLLAGELSHRLKNSLTMVQAIVSQTLRNAPDVASAKDVLAARLQALGRAHDILMSGSGESADIAVVIEGALRLHTDGESERIRIAGPSCLIDASAALSLSLMIHELATNALKYGALLGSRGTVAITWCLEDHAGEPMLALRWQERGGPAVMPPTRHGFGSRLIERGLAGTTGGHVSIAYPTDGVVCTFTAPQAGLQARLGERG